MDFGALTLATPADYQKAIGLALSLRVSNPGVPVAVACSPKVRPLVAKYFDYTIDDDPTISGFMHKLHLDRYSPFKETFFFRLRCPCFSALERNSRLLENATIFCLWKLCDNRREPIRVR